jgi:hypothetical protein
VGRQITIRVGSVAIVRGRRPNVAYWHLADKRTQPSNGRYWGHSGQNWSLACVGYDAIDPSATLAVHCGNGFDTGFSLYRSTRLSR